MTISENMVVSLNYKLSNHKTGETIEETTTENPMVFLFGVGGIIPEFEENISGLSVGDAFEFSIQAENAYGLPDENQVAMIPLDVFRDEQGNFDTEYFVVGAMIPMSDSEGNHLRGIIRDVTAEAVHMDFNHPLAGTDLHFSGSIAAIRPATDDELAHGHVHGPGGHQH
jgi:FKBP-type peptidyl-prolyl cis-trans isomerase SlyD